MRILVPWGFYGWGNIGDESTLQGFARLVTHHGNGLRAWVASRDPKHTSLVEPSFRYFHAVNRDLRRRWARLRSSAYAVAGGTPIMDVLGDWPLSEVVPLVRAANDARKPIVFVGTGTETLQRPESCDLVRRALAPAVRHWTLRSERDRIRLAACGVPADRMTVAADLAWLLSPVNSDFGQSVLHQLRVPASPRLIGINLTNEAFVATQAPHLFEELSLFLDALTDRGDTFILFLANEIRPDESFDTAAARRVLAHMKHPERALLVPNRYWTPQQMLSLIACCDFTISMRYHFCLFSALQGIPFFAITRSDKVADLCWDLDWPHASDPKDIRAGQLLRSFEALESDRPRWTAELDSGSSRMRQRALINTVGLQSLLTHVCAD